MFMDLLSEQPNSLMVFGAACSDVTEILAEMSAYRNLAQVCYIISLNESNDSGKKLRRIEVSRGRKEGKKKGLFVR